MRRLSHRRPWAAAVTLTAAVAAVAAVAVPATGETPPAAAASPIRHVVVLYLENHSFDNVFGYWCNQNPGRCPDGSMPATVTLSNGVKVTPGVMPDTVPDSCHEVHCQVTAIDGGKMDGWGQIDNCTKSKSYACIAGYQPAQVPNAVSLAKSFAISDKFFSEADSPSWGGHLYAVMSGLDGFTGDIPRPVPGVTAGPGWGCDSNKKAPWVSPSGTIEQMPSCVPDPSLNASKYPYGGAFAPTQVAYAPTIMDRLHTAGLFWRIYGSTAGTLGGYDFAICPAFAECLDTGQRAHLVPDNRFLTAAANSRLAAFSIITPGGSNTLDSEHNLMSMTAGDNWLGQIVSAVEKSPEWSSTVLFITWDDCGCFYDQVAPPTAPDGTQEGPRVPLIAISPYAKPGYTDTTDASFASILAFTEHTFGLAPLGVNDAKAYDLSGLFNYSQAPLRPVRMVSRPLPASAKRIRLTKELLNDVT